MVAGEKVLVDVILAGKPAVPVKWTLDKSSLVLPPGWSTAPEPMKEKENSGTSRFSVTIPADAKRALTPADAVLPFPPPLVRLALPRDVEGYEFKIEKPVESSIAKTTGIETYPLELIPAVTLTVDPAQVMVPGKARLVTDHLVRAGALPRDASRPKSPSDSTRPRLGPCSPISRSISQRPAIS